jgi:hypothetical protein
MDGYLSSKPDNFVDDPKKIYRLRRYKTQHAWKLDFVDLKPEDEGSLESPKNSPPQSPREKRLPSMGEQLQERKIVELCTSDIINLPIFTSRRLEGRLRSRPQQSAWCNIHPSPVKKTRTFASKRSFNYVRHSTWTG